MQHDFVAKQDSKLLSSASSLRCVLAAGLAVCALYAAQAGAQSAPAGQYEQDVANCKSGAANQDLDACLREARAARAAARQLHQDVNVSGQYGQNAMTRCNALPAAARENCRALMMAPARTQGSVAGGGVLREMVVPVPPPTHTAPAGGGMPSAPIAVPYPIQ